LRKKIEDSPGSEEDLLQVKIIGHQPGWANKQTEAVIDSDFTAGQSWTHYKDALALLGVETSGADRKSIQRGFDEYSKMSLPTIKRNLRLAGIDVQLTKDVYSARAKTIFKHGKLESRILSYNPAFFSKCVGRERKALVPAIKFGIAHEALEFTAPRYEPRKFFGQKQIGHRAPILPKSVNMALDWKAGRYFDAFADALSWSHEDISVITGEMRFAKALGLNYKNMQGVQRLKSIDWDVLYSRIDFANQPRSKSFLKNYVKMLVSQSRRTGGEAPPKRSLMYFFADWDELDKAERYLKLIMKDTAEKQSKFSWLHKMMLGIETPKPAPATKMVSQSSLTLSRNIHRVSSKMGNASYKASVGIKNLLKSLARR